MNPMNDQVAVTMYRTRGCPFCVMAAEFLEREEIEFEEVFLDDHADRRGFTAELMPGHFTVPLVVVGGRPVGGLDELRRVHASGELGSLLRGNG